MEQVGLWVGFVLTLMVFSYILGDNVLYRLAVYSFVGLAAGFVTVITWESVIWPWLNGTALAEGAGLPELVIGALPLALGALLLLKGSVRLGRVGNLALAFVVGVGTAVALVGAVTGTLIPLAVATGSGVSANLVNGGLVVLGVVCTLFYFQYLARRRPGGVVTRGPFSRTLGFLGQGVIVVTLGALYAAAILTSLTIFSERVSFILGRISGG